LKGKRQSAFRPTEMRDAAVADDVQLHPKHKKTRRAFAAAGFELGGRRWLAPSIAGMGRDF